MGHRDHNGRPGPLGRSLFWVGLFALAYFAGAELGHRFGVGPGPFATFWPPAGLSLAVLVQSAPLCWPLFLLAALPANLASGVLLHDQPVAVNLALWLADSLAAAAGAWLIRRWVGPLGAFRGLREVLGVVLLAALVSPAVAATAAALAVWAALGTPFGQAWQAWWPAAVVGVLVFVPLVLTASPTPSTNRGETSRRGAGPGVFENHGPLRLVEGFALLVGLAALCQVIFGGSSPVLASPYLVLPFLLWAALRVGPGGVAAAVFLLAVVALHATAQGQGPFAAAHLLPWQRALVIQSFLGVSALGFLTLAALTQEWQDATAALRRANADLESRVRERTLDLTRTNVVLGQQQELLRVTLASIADGVITTDTGGLVTFLNALAQALTGWPEGEAVGRPLGQVFALLGENTSDSHLRGDTRGSSRRGDLALRDGRQLPVEYSASLIRDREGNAVGSVLVFRDASERLRAEALQRDLHTELERLVAQRTDELRGSEERLRLLVEGTRDYAIFMLDPEGRIISWNPGAQRINGYEAGEILGQHFSRFYPPEDVQAGKPAEELRVASDRGRYEEEGWRVRKDGSRFWSSVIVTALRDGAGRLQGFSKITRDLTQHREAEEQARRLFEEEAARAAAEATAEAIRGQREQLRVTLASIGDGVIVANPAGRVTLINPVAEVMTGWRAEEAAGQPLEQVFHVLNEQTRQPLESPVVQVLREGTIVGLSSHSVLLTRAGVERPIVNSAAPIRDGQGRIRGVVLVFHDVTEKRRAELQLQESEQRLRLALEGGRMGVWEWDLETDAVWWSDNLEPLHGLAPGTFDGTREAYLQVVHPDDRELVDQALARAVESRGHFDVEFRCGTPAQQVREGAHAGVQPYRWLASQGKVFCADDGRPVRVVGVDMDVTERKNAAEAAQQVTERLRQSEARLKEADEKKTAFLAVLAHELRNPLAPVRNCLQLFRMRQADPALLERARDVMERQVTHLVRLVDDLLDVSRILRGKVQLRKGLLDVAAVLARAVETAQPVLDAQGQEVVVDLPPEPPRVEGDEIRLSQVFGNLLTNAAKYSQRAGRIWLTARQEGNEMVVGIRDEGIGIPPDLLERIFDMFAQVDSSIGRSQGGLGIGLTLVRSLVEMHGGQVTAHSAGPGKGSEFVVRLPLPKVEAGRKTEDGTPGSKSASGVGAPAAVSRKILVVDDNVDAADSLAILLRLSGHEVRVANDGLTALDVAPRFMPAVVLLDIGMPVLDGYEVARRLRRRSELAGTRIVALTGWGAAEDRVRSSAAGFDEHLTKPVDPEVLDELLAALPRG